MKKAETTAEAFERFEIAIRAVFEPLLEPYVKVLRRILDWLSSRIAHVEAKTLEGRGRLCRDKRNRNSYFIRAKRLRKENPLNKL